MVERKNLISWARSCHYDGLIAVKEVKGKKWMTILSAIEIIGDFNIDDIATTDLAWDKIRTTLKNMTEEEIWKLHIKKENYA